MDDTREPDPTQREATPCQESHRCPMCLAGEPRRLGLHRGLIHYECSRCGWDYLDGDEP